MLSSDIMVCRACGRLSMTVVKGICPDCVKKMEDRFPDVKDYVFDNPGATMNEVSKACNVGVWQLRQWIREERLELVVNDGSITCDFCGKMINKGKYCDACKAKLLEKLNGAQSGTVTDPVQEHRINKMRFISKGL